jgi:hypothetical protein
MAPYAVSGDAIVDAETGDPVTPDEFNLHATPEEKAKLERDLTSRSLMTNQEGEGGSAQVDEGLTNEPDATPSTVSSSSTASSGPLPDRTEPPSLEEFLAVAGPDNPKTPRKALVSYWNKTYGHVDPTTLPTLDTFMKEAKVDNPDVPDHKLETYWTDTYGVMGAQEHGSSLLRRAADVPVGLVKGVVDLPKIVVGLADIPSNGAASRGTATVLKVLGEQADQRNGPANSSNSTLPKRKPP